MEETALRMYERFNFNDHDKVAQPSNFLYSKFLPFITYTSCYGVCTRFPEIFPTVGKSGTSERRNIKAIA